MRDERPGLRLENFGDTFINNEEISDKHSDKEGSQPTTTTTTTNPLAINRFTVFKMYSVSPQTIPFLGPLQVVSGRIESYQRK